MSKPKLHTKDKIRDQALKMFNERGIEYVGLRELAAVLDMRVSNITYYFPTKDDLVYAISQELSKANAAIVVPGENITPFSFMQLLHQVFRNHLKFRCLFLSIVHVMEQNKAVAAAYRQTQTDRYAALSANMKAMASGGYLDLKAETVLETLVATLALLSRFWISEARISYRHLDEEAQLQHYLGLVVQLLLPHATAKGKTDFRRWAGREEAIRLTREAGSK